MENNFSTEWTKGKTVGKSSWRWVLTVLLFIFLPPVARAQLVADGQTAIYDGVSTNISGGITIGTNGSFTLLVLTNGAKVTNTSGSTIIGNNALAKTNSVVVTGSGSLWQTASGFYVGNGGPASELDILNGGTVFDTVGYLGQLTSSSNNLVVISGSGSVWSNSSGVLMGNSSPGNKVIVTNGGQVFSGSSGVIISQSSTAAVSNSIIITGPGSTWTNTGSLDLGYRTQSGNQILINNGGHFINSGSPLGIGINTVSNSITVADSGSLLQGQSLYFGYSCTANQCVVSNGATLAFTSLNTSTVLGTYSIFTVTGAGSMWTNAADLKFGDISNSLYITAGGSVVDNNGTISSTIGLPNTVLIGGTNSLWKNLADLHLGQKGQLLITNGGTLIDGYAYCGDASVDSNTFALISGPGSLWTNRQDIYLGNNSPGNQLVISNQATVVTHNFFLGGSASSVSNNLLVDGGTLTVSNAGSGLLDGRRGTINLNSGLIRCDIFSLNNGTTSKFIFNGGALQSRSSGVNNGVPFVVGDGAGTAILNLNGFGGQHTFNNGLVISNNATLTGIGIIRSNVTVCSGGTFSPGNSNTFYLSILGSLVLNPGSTTFCPLNSGTLSAHSVAGLTNIVYGGTLQVSNVFAPAGYSPGSSFKLFYANNYSGAFDAIVPSTPGPHLRWDTNELAVDGVLRIFSTNTPPPRFSGSALVQGNLMVNAANGIPYDACHLLTSTNIGAAQIDWTCIATNYFDANGLTGFTNAISSNESQRYFRLQVN